MRLPELMASWTTRIVAVAFCLPLVLNPSARAADGSDSVGGACPCDRHDPVWMISTRHLGCPCIECEPDLRILRYDESGEQWSDATLQAFLEEDNSQRPTVIYVHGNRTSWDEAFQRGWQFYHALATDLNPELCFRFVIWSWPTDQLRGPIRDARAKACRSNSDGLYLGWLLSQMNPDTQVSLVGYSFGARVVTGAMHTLNGGALVGQSLPTESPASRTPLRAVLLAAAIHSDWLLPGRPHDNVWTVTDKLAVLYNSCDPVLRRYRFVERRGRPQALGYVGFWGDDQLGPTAERVSNQDVSCYVGRTHDVHAYFCSSKVMSWVRETAFWRITNGHGHLSVASSEMGTD